jgi:hypothetical protein
MSPSKMLVASALGLLLIAALIATPVLHGQATPRPIAPGNTVLLAEYDCDASRLDEADQLVVKNVAPILNKHMAAGRIINWGYMGNYLGGSSDRAIYVWAADPVALVQVRQQYLPEIQKQAGFAEFSRICGAGVVTLRNLITASGPGTR